MDDWYSWDYYYEISQKIGYDFKNPILLKQAFTRKSYSHEHPDVYDNEQLEFYGDAYLSYYMANYLLTHYGETSSDGQFVSLKNEDELTKFKAQNVNKQNLSWCIELLDLQKFLILGESDIKNNVYESDSVKEDLFEAIIGAVAIDSKRDTFYIFKVCSTMLKTANFEYDYISILNDWCLEDNVDQPTYCIKEHSYIQKTTKGRFVKFDRECTLTLYNKQFTGYGETPYFAKMKAAESAYFDFMGKSMEKEVGKPNFDTASSQLNELIQKGFVDKIDFKYKDIQDEDGNTQWYCECEVPILNNTYSDTKNTKKEVKNILSYTILLDLMKS